MKCQNCGHAVRRNSFDALYHCRKECEYSVTCWECDCGSPATDEIQKRGEEE